MSVSLTPISGKEGYKNLVRLVARALYSGQCPPPDPAAEAAEPRLRNKSQKTDNTGLAVILLDMLCMMEWVGEHELASRCNLHLKQVRKVMQYLEQEQVVMREHLRIKQQRRGATDTTQAASADGSNATPTAAGTPNTNTTSQQQLDEDAPRLKSLLHSYCAIDYARLHDVVQLKTHLLRKKLKAQIKDSDALQGYACPSCHATYTSLDAAHLMDFTTGAFHCEHCGSELRHTFGGGGVMGDEGARRKHVAAMKGLLSSMESQCKPIIDQLTRIKDVVPPDYGALLDWSQLQKQRYIARQKAGAAGTMRLDEQGIPLFSVDLAEEADSADAATRAPAAPKIAVPWLTSTAGGVTAAGAAAAGSGDVGGAMGAHAAGPSTAAGAAPAGGFAAAGGGGVFGSGQHDNKGGAGSGQEVKMDPAQQEYMLQFMEALKKQTQQLAQQGRSTTNATTSPVEEGPATKRQRTVDGWAQVPAVEQPPITTNNNQQDDLEWEDAAPAARPQPPPTQDGDDLAWEEA